MSTNREDFLILGMLPFKEDGYRSITQKSMILSKNNGIINKPVATNR